MENSSPYILTIAIPTYNGFKTIEDTLSSCLEVDSNEVEFLIVDNGSLPKTKEVIDNWIQKYSDKIQVNYFRHPENVGYDKNIISIFKYAQGQYVHILADDDAFYPKAVQSLLAILKNNPSIAGIISNFDHYDTELKQIINTLTINNNESRIINKLSDFIRSSGGRYGQVSTVTLKKSLVNQMSVDQFIGYQYIHIYLIFEILKTNSLFINAKAILKIRAGSPNFEKKGDDKITVPLGGMKIYDHFKYQMGLSFYCHFLFQNSLYLAKSIYGGKKQGLRSPFKTFLILIKNQYSNPFFWILLLPIYILPIHLISLFKTKK